jgi:hypothetical protein
VERSKFLMPLTRHEANRPGSVEPDPRIRQLQLSEAAQSGAEDISQYVRRIDLRAAHCSVPHEFQPEAPPSSLQD